MNRSFRAEESGQRQRQPLMGSIRSSDEELSLFLEMRRREKERNNNLFLQKPDEFDPLGSKNGSSPAFNIASAAPVRRTRADDFLNADNDKSDYDWLLTPPGTPLFPTLEMESRKTVMSQLGTSRAHPTALTSRLTNPLPEATARSNIESRQLASSSGLNSSSSSLRRPSSSGGSRPSTPTGRPTLSSSRSTMTSASRSTSNAATKAMTSTATSKTMSTTTTSRSSRSATPTSRATMTSAKPTVPPRSSTPTARSNARSSTPTSRASITASKSTSRAATPTRRPTSMSSTTNTTVPPVKPLSSFSGTKSAITASRNSAAPRASSPTVKPRPWKPSDMPGFSLDAPPNLRTSLSDRPVSATRGRPGAPSARSSSVEPASNGRIRRQSCSPARGRPPNGVVHSSGSSVPVPSMSRLHAKANDNVSPVLVGTKMVERVINMRKLVRPKQDDKHSPHSNLSAKSSSPDSSGFGRSLSKKSLDMAIRHMDIRQRIPGNLRPLMTNIPASSMYSVRSGPSRSRTSRSISVPDSPLATSSNASSEVSVSNNAVYFDGSEIDDDVSSDKGVRSPASVHGR
ncbi:putative GPI-anchored protein pfl2 [Nicotiana tomentosiformis]|uniref:putative GPI-anchored protein pfl2 n=1 Tax=Nicotiana tomentosiformis TaxID=4098 RepID=UPI00051BCE2C|nr:putative GPI-anchored protein pfl2 [Nicotiana tomentosiformis]